MPEYWVRQDRSNEIFGPYDRAAVGRMAADGSLARDWLISPDRRAWHRAGEVTGLFPPGASVAHAAPPGPVAVLAGPEAPAPTLEYYGPTPGAFTGGVAAPAAGVVAGFYAVAVLMFFSGATCTTAAFLGEPIIMALAALATFLFCAPALILWVVWLYQAHTAVQRMSGGAYPISPGTAVGFSFIPLFSGFWVIYMPMKLAAQLNRMAGRNVVSVPAVVILQSLSVVAALLFAGLTPVFYAVSMTLIQRSIKQMLAS